MPITKKRIVIGHALRPSAGIEVVYRRKLDALINEMANSLEYWLSARWKKNPPVLAQDENPARGLLRTMRVLRKRWESRFDDAAERLAEWFARSVLRRTTLAMEKTLEAGKIPVVEFKMSAAARDAFNAVVGENVALIKSIAQQHLTAVETAVTRSVTTGRDLGSLAKALQHAHGVTKRRAALIALHQNNMASAVITRVRQQESGITTAVWVHSHAGKHPRPEHVAFDGKTYEVAKGAWLEERWTWPGVEIGCRCFSKPLLAGF